MKAFFRSLLQSVPAGLVVAAILLLALAAMPSKFHLPQSIAAIGVGWAGMCPGASVAPCEK